MSTIESSEFLGRLFFKGDHNILIITINMYLLIEIRHNDGIQYHGNYIEVKKNACLKLTF